MTLILRNNKVLLALVLLLAVASGQQPVDDTAFESQRTQQFLGVPLKEFPPSQRLTGLDELPTAAPTFKFSLTEQPLSGAKPRAFYELRNRVEARGPDGTIYEAYVGHDDPEQIVPGHHPISTPANTRQRYGAHYGYGYNPQDAVIGQRQAGRLKPALFFRDVGSHTTAPHYIAIDSRRQVHLAVADVNIFQDNRLDLYWAIGDPASGKWTEAWLIDRRGFTSWSNPWMGASGDKVHLLWTFSKDDDYEHVFVISRSLDGSWTRPAQLPIRIAKDDPDASVSATSGGAFIIRIGSTDTKEWVLNPGRVYVPTR